MTLPPHADAALALREVIGPQGRGLPLQKRQALLCGEQLQAAAADGAAGAAVGKHGHMRACAARCGAAGMHDGAEDDRSAKGSGLQKAVKQCFHGFSPQ